MPRPAAYDRDSVIELALRQFWTEGFAGSDVEQLTRSAGVNRHSLYKAFGGKQGLFAQVIARYIDTVAADFMEMLGQGRGLDAILAYFRRINDAIDRNPARYDGMRGCLVTNTVVEMGHDEHSVMALIDSYYRRLDDGFRAAIVRGQGDGSIRSDCDAASVAAWLVLTTQGLGVAGRFGMPADNLETAIRGLLCAPSSAATM